MKIVIKNREKIPKNFIFVKPLLSNEIKKNWTHTSGISAFLKRAENTFKIIERLKVILLE